MKKIHLICNAHLDPVWQWEFQEGVGAVLSTFRAAADFCEEFDGFVFNHNEALIYEWVEQYEPSLFDRIKKLVREEKWHIMGSWYLQPDCNMPSGESFVRQIEAGHRFFLSKFGMISQIGINFDPFGHTRGLVQILEQAGYMGYICCRPYASEMYTPTREFVWKGFNNSTILVHRSDSYNSKMGHVDEKIEKYIKEFCHMGTGLLLWGVGNHGGGPSREDLHSIKELKAKYSAIEIVHSTPEAYFDDLKMIEDSLFVWDKDINPTFPGCYTSQVRIKQTHARLEQELYLTEKMCVHAEVIGNMKYPNELLAEAEKKLLLAEFHDILPGSSIREVEDQGLEIMHHGLNILRQIKAEAFYALCRGEKRAKAGSYPVLVYNPHPFEVRGVLETELMLDDQYYDTENLIFPQVYENDRKIPTQALRERSNIPIQWRKRVAFYALLKPFTITRFDIMTDMRDIEKRCLIESGKDYFDFDNGEMTIRLDLRTGLLNSYRVGGVEYLDTGCSSIGVFQDDEDSWGMRNLKYSESQVGAFQLVTDRAKNAKIAANNTEELEAIRVIEDGEIYTNVECIFEYEESYAVINYIFNKVGSSFGINIRIANSLKNRFLKLLFPLRIHQANIFGKTAFGLNQLDMNGVESVSQDYLIVAGNIGALSVIKPGIYGSHFKNNCLALSLLRSPAYCAHPIGDRKTICEDRFVERVDQGVRNYEFYINASERNERFAFIENESQTILQKPQITAFFPTGDGEAIQTLFSLDNYTIQISSMKKSVDGHGYILRLFNSTDSTQKFQLISEVLELDQTDTLAGFEVKTFFIANKIFRAAPIIDIEKM